MLQDANVPFDEIDITQLPPEEKAVVVENILKVSKIDTATVPAAVVGCGEGVIQWFSNHGSCEVTEMFEEIRAALRT